MLAYVFWHWRRLEVDRASYEAKLGAFHAMLDSHKPMGFVSSTVFSLPRAPWLDTGNDAYEDWYLLENSGAMDVLNDYAVSGVSEQPHDAIAMHATGGTAGLYRLRAGSDNQREMKYASWFAKPRGVRYAEMYSELESLASLEDCSLWGRQMTLGPTEEFCIQSRNPLDLPLSFTSLTIPLWRVWPN
ncbi:MAG: hypothetical protein ABR555_14510 [Pyrinomonadaceae bacterium]